MVHQQGKMKPSAARLRQADEHSTMFLEPTMSTSLQLILSEICQKMSVVPAVMSRVPVKSKQQVLPSISYLLNQLQIIVSDVNTLMSPSTSTSTSTSN